MMNMPHMQDIVTGETGSPVEAARNMFFEDARGYFDAIRVGLGATVDAQRVATRDIGNKATLMGSTFRLFVGQLYTYNPDAAVDSMAQNLGAFESSMANILKPYLSRGILLTDKNYFTNEIVQSLNKMKQKNSELPMAVVLGHAGERVLLYNAFSWVRALTRFGVTGTNGGAEKDSV